MRLRDLSMLVASAALAALSAAALIASLKSEPTIPVDVSVRMPSQPSPPDHEDIRVYQLGNDGSGDYRLAILRKVPNPFHEHELRWTLTFYSLEERGGHKAGLNYLGSRCIEYDMGFDNIEFAGRKQYMPEDFRKAAEKARQMSRDD